MSIRYTLRHNIPHENVEAEDVSDPSTWDLNMLKKHELAETDDYRIVYRQHDGEIVDLSGAAAQYATNIGNQILHDGDVLNQKIEEWTPIVNNGINQLNTAANSNINRLNRVVSNSYQTFYDVASNGTIVRANIVQTDNQTIKVKISGNKTRVMIKEDGKKITELSGGARTKSFSITTCVWLDIVIVPEDFNWVQGSLVVDGNIIYGKYEEPENFPTSDEEQYGHWIIGVPLGGMVNITATPARWSPAVM